MPYAATTWVSNFWFNSDGALANWTTQPVFNLLIFSYITGPCQVIETGSNTLQPCVFPFVLNGRRFDECTTHLDPNQGQAHHMFSRFLNIQFFCTIFSLFWFSTRWKFSTIEIKNPVITVYHKQKKTLSSPSKVAFVQKVRLVFSNIQISKRKYSKKLS